MNLWIRSQDRECLEIIHTVVIPEFDKKAILGYGLDGKRYILGTYKTKERALEVLDEIDKYKDKLEKAHFLGMEESKFVSSTFKMPKE